MRALVVDDEEAIRHLAILALSRHGVVCDSASSGQDALALLDATRYDLVLTDLRMPDGHGQALCLEILSRPERPAVVVLTGVLEQRLAEDLKSRGVDRIYFKPIRFGPLAADLYGLIVARRDRQLVPTPAATAVGGSEKSAGARRPHTLIVGPPVPGRREPNRKSSERVVVAVLRKTRGQSTSLARTFKELGVDAMDLEGADQLRRLMAANRVPLLVVENELNGFLTGLEIIRKLRADSIRVPAMLLDPNEKPLADVAQSLGLVTLVNSAANNDEIAETGRLVMQQSK